MWPFRREKRVPMAPIQTVEVPGFTLIMAHPSEVRSMARDNDCPEWERALGFCHMGKRLVVVQWGAKSDLGVRLPDLEVLGHEVMHLIYDNYHTYRKGGTK